MAESSTAAEIDASFVNDAKKMADEIIEILDLDGSESKGQIVNDLFENGRQSLAKYEDEIIVELYKDVMNGSENKLMCLLKKYYRGKWELHCGKSNSWFGSFIEKYQSGENHDIYERVLTHAAEYGDKITENYRVLSIVLQFLFEGIDVECWTKTKLYDDQYLKKQPTSDSQYLKETENSDDPFQTETSICDGLWYAITHDGLQSITKYSDYIAPFVMDEQLNKSQSILFQALREYYRTQLFSFLKENNIADKQKLYDLALDNVAEHGWLTGIQVIQQKVAPKYYKSLLENLNYLLQKQKAQANQALKEQEGNKDLNAQNENKKPDKPGQNKEIKQQRQNVKEDGQVGNKNKNAKKEEKNENKKKPNENEDSTEQDKSAQIEKEEANREGGKEQKQQPACNLKDINTSSENKQTEASLTEAAVAHNQETGPQPPIGRNKIFITGLPTDMSEQRLFDTVWDEFSTSVGKIKINGRTKKPWIDLFRQKENKAKLSGMAVITFEEEKSVKEAIRVYHPKRVLALNNASILARQYKENNNRPRPPDIPDVPRPLSRVRPGTGQPDGKVYIFWDIQNVAIPAGHKAFDVAMKLMQMLITDRKLSKGYFVAFCNTRDMSEEHRIGLSNASVKIQDVASRKTGAVDWHISDGLQEFGSQQKEPCTVVLISGDSDFILLLNKLRFDYKHYVIVVYGGHAKSDFLQTANEAHPWEKFTENCATNNNNPAKKTMGLEVSNANRGSKFAGVSNFDNRTESPKVRPLMGVQLALPAGDEASELILTGPHDSTDTHQPTLQNSLIASKKHEIVKSQTPQKKSRRKNKSSNLQPPELLQSATGGLTKNTLMDCNLFVQTTDNTHALEKQNGAVKNEHSFCCFECNRTFPTKAARDQHLKDKHNLGELIQFSRLPSINDLNSQCQLNIDGSQPENDLIAFDADGDNGLSQASLMLATMETLCLIDFEDDGNDTDG